MAEKKQNKSKRTIVIGSVAAVLMFGFCFALVPLYSVLCQATGINTSAADSELLKGAVIDPNVKPDLSRTITVQFISINHMGMPWEFYPKVKSIRVHPGQTAKVYFWAKNTTKNDMTVQAIPSMTPTESIGHFHKIECFCFTQQTLKAYQGRMMPLVFNVDKDLPKDIHVITLAYTLFDVTPKKAS